MGENKVQQWEYLGEFLDENRDKTLPELGELGLGGWEMCGCVRFELLHGSLFYFKRPILTPPNLSRAGETEGFKCPSCGMPWDVLKNNTCQCGAYLVPKDKAIQTAARTERAGEISPVEKAIKDRIAFLIQAEKTAIIDIDKVPVSSNARQVAWNFIHELGHRKNELQDILKIMEAPPTPAPEVKEEGKEQTETITLTEQIDALRKENQRLTAYAAEGDTKFSQLFEKCGSMIKERD